MNTGSSSLDNLNNALLEVDFIAVSFSYLKYYDSNGISYEG